MLRPLMRRNDERNVPVESSVPGPSAEDVFADFVKNANAVAQLGNTVRVPLSDIAPKLIETSQPEQQPISRIEALRPRTIEEVEGSELDLVDETPVADPTPEMLALLIEEELADADVEPIEAIPLTRFKSSRPPPPPVQALRPKSIPSLALPPPPSTETPFFGESHPAATEDASGIAVASDFSRASQSPAPFGARLPGEAVSLEASASPWAMLELAPMTQPSLAPPFPDGITPEPEPDVEELSPDLLVDEPEEDEEQELAPSVDRTIVEAFSSIEASEASLELEPVPEELTARPAPRESLIAPRISLEGPLPKHESLPPALQYPEGEVEPVPSELELPMEKIQRADISADAIAPTDEEAEEEFEELDERDIVPDVASLAPPPPPLPEVGEDGQIPAGEMDRFLRDMAVLRRYGHRAQVHRGFEEILRRYPEDLLLLRRVVEFHVEENEKAAAIELLFSLAGRLFERRNVKGMRAALEQVLVLDADNKRATKLIGLLGVRPDTQPGV